MGRDKRNPISQKVPVCESKGLKLCLSIVIMSFQENEKVPPSPYPVLQQPPENGQAPPIVQAVPRILFGPDSVTTVCPNCRANITTETKSEVGIIAWIAAGSLCGMGFCGILCWFCAPIPLCMDSLKVEVIIFL